MPKRVTTLGNNKFKVRATIGYDNGKAITKSLTIICPKGESQAYEMLGKLEEEWKKNYVKPNKLTVSALVDRWMKECAPISCNSPVSIDYYVEIRKRIDTAMGNLEVSKITTSNINLFISSLKQEISPRTHRPLAIRTIKKHQNFLKQIFKSALEWKLIGVDPCVGMTKIKLAKTEKEIPDDEEMQKLFTVVEKAKFVHKAIFYLLVETGIRREELCGLKWEYVNLSRKTITIAEARVKSKGTIQKDTKTAAGHRTITITKRCASILEHLRGYEYVFTNNGKPYHPDSITHIIPKLCSKSKIKAYTPHSIRHWVCSTLLDAGMPIKQVSYTLGHADASTTLDVYAHILKHTKHNSANVMEKCLGHFLGH